MRINKLFLITFLFHIIFATPFAQSNEIKNFAHFGPGLYRGGRPQGADFKTLKNLKVKTVINLQGGDLTDSEFGLVAGIISPGEWPDWIGYEKKMVESMGIKFLNVPINSLDALDNKQGYGLGRALALLANPQNQPVYVHCEHGIDRTGLLVALHRVFYQKWTRQSAHQEMVESGHGLFRQIFTGDLDQFFWAVTEGEP